MWSKCAKLVMMESLLKVVYRKSIIRGSSGTGALKWMEFARQGQ